MYRGSTGQPALSTHFAVRNGALLSRWYNPFTASPLPHDSRVVQEWLSQQAIVELLNWLSRAPDMNPIENMWSEVKRTMQETWPVLPPRNSDELWALVSDVWDEVASSKRYIRS